jgi:hypothetical protein
MSLVLHGIYITKQYNCEQEARNKHQSVKILNAASVYNVIAIALLMLAGCSLLLDSCLCLLLGDGSEPLLQLPSAALMTARIHSGDC